MKQKNRNIPLMINEPVKTEYRRLKALKKHPTYLDTVNYLQQIKVYREYYYDDKILILFYQDSEYKFGLDNIFFFLYIILYFQTVIQSCR